MQYDITLSPEQLQAIADWATTGPDVDFVKLRKIGDGGAHAQRYGHVTALQGDAYDRFDIAGNIVTQA